MDETARPKKVRFDESANETVEVPDNTAKLVRRGAIPAPREWTARRSIDDDADDDADWRAFRYALADLERESLQERLREARARRDSEARRDVRASPSDRRRGAASRFWPSCFGAGDVASAPRDVATCVALALCAVAVCAVSAVSGA